jgi:hypothetical protein
MQEREKDPEDWQEIVGSSMVNGTTFYRIQTLISKRYAISNQRMQLLAYMKKTGERFEDRNIVGSRNIGEKEFYILETVIEESEATEKHPHALFDFLENDAE